MKQCSKCKTLQPLSSFGSRKIICKQCHRQMRRAWYRANKQHHLQNIRRFNQTVNERISNWKKTLKCCVCSEKESCCLEFHHVDDTTKDFNLSHSWRTVGLPKYISELNKCVVVCSNCHKKIHKKLIKLRRNIARIKISKATFASVV